MLQQTERSAKIDHHKRFLIDTADFSSRLSSPIDRLDDLPGNICDDRYKTPEQIYPFDRSCAVYAFRTLEERDPDQPATQSCDRDHQPRYP
jgi:hypothetical protein